MSLKNRHITGKDLQLVIKSIPELIFIIAEFILRILQKETKYHIYQLSSTSKPMASSNHQKVAVTLTRKNPAFLRGFCVPGADKSCNRLLDDLHFIQTKELLSY
jgi:hypothetical protein